MENREAEGEGVVEFVGEALIPDGVECLGLGGGSGKMVLVNVNEHVRVEDRRVDLPEDAALLVGRLEIRRLADLNAHLTTEHVHSRLITLHGQQLLDVRDEFDSGRCAVLRRRRALADHRCQQRMVEPSKRHRAVPVVRSLSA